MVLERFPSDLSKEAKARKIKLYTDLIREYASKNEDGDQIFLESSSETSNENTENLRELINGLLFVETVEEPYNEVIIKLNDNDRPALEFIVRQNAQIKEEIANISSPELLKICITFFLNYM